MTLLRLGLLQPHAEHRWSAKVFEDTQFMGISCRPTVWVCTRLEGWRSNLPYRSILGLMSPGKVSTSLVRIADYSAMLLKFCRR